MPGRDDRTLTEARPPGRDEERRDVPVLIVAGSADAPGLGRRRRVAFVGDGLEIGRHPPSGAPINHLVLGDPLVSTKHARIGRSQDGFELVDHGSKNGSLVDRREVEGRASLRDGSILYLGAHVAIFRLVSDVEADAINDELASALGPVPTTSPRLAAACQRMRRLGASPAEVLFVGETGTGKEVYARAVHRVSGRSGPFVAINCAAIPRELVESELFGYRPGAHSTAHTAKAGLVEEADGGTLFLDEVGEMAPEAQAKLLRFLQDRELMALGSTRPRRVDVRVMAATSRPLTGASVGGVRDDLLGRLGASPMVLPPLRHRLEDLGALLAHFSARVPDLRFTLPAFRALFKHQWPLNVREVEKAVATVIALADGGTRPVEIRDLPEAIGNPGAAWAFEEEASDEEAEATPDTPTRKGAPGPSPAELEALLKEHRGNVADVSRALGRQRAAVWRWLKKYSLSPDKYRV